MKKPKASNKLSEKKSVKALDDNPDLPYQFVKQALTSHLEKEKGNLEAYTFN